jgi:hypothetical protein
VRSSRQVARSGLCALCGRKTDILTKGGIVGQETGEIVCGRIKVQKSR